MSNIIWDKAIYFFVSCINQNIYDYVIIVPVTLVGIRDRADFGESVTFLPECKDVVDCDVGYVLGNNGLSSGRLPSSSAFCSKWSSVCTLNVLYSLVLIFNGGKFQRLLDFNLVALLFCVRWAMS